MSICSFTGREVSQEEVFMQKNKLDLREAEIRTYYVTCEQPTNNFYEIVDDTAAIKSVFQVIIDYYRSQLKMDINMRMFSKKDIHPLASGGVDITVDFLVYSKSPRDLALLRDAAVDFSDILNLALSRSNTPLFKVAEAYRYSYGKFAEDTKHPHFHLKQVLAETKNQLNHQELTS